MASPRVGGGQVTIWECMACMGIGQQPVGMHDPSKHRKMWIYLSTFETWQIVICCLSRLSLTKSHMLKDCSLTDGLIVERQLDAKDSSL